MSQPAKPRVGGPLKTVFILGAGVPGDRAAEPQAVYFARIHGTTYEMTFNPNGAKRFATKALAELFRKTLNGHHRFTVVEHVLYRQIVK